MDCREALINRLQPVSKLNVVPSMSDVPMIGFANLLWWQITNPKIGGNSFGPHTLYTVVSRDTNSKTAQMTSTIYSHLLLRYKPQPNLIGFSVAQHSSIAYDVVKVTEYNSKDYTWDSFKIYWQRTLCKLQWIEEVGDEYVVYTGSRLYDCAPQPALMYSVVNPGSLPAPLSNTNYIDRYFTLATDTNDTATAFDFEFKVRCGWDNGPISDTVLENCFQSSKTEDFRIKKSIIESDIIIANGYKRNPYDRRQMATPQIRRPR